jgi:2-dehydropantoate 2-reductase
MRILVYGAGAVGGYLGGILAATGKDVTLVARGAQYDAMSSRGVILEGPKSGRPDPIKVKVCRPGEEKGLYDVVFVGLKSHQITENAKHLAGLMAKDGTIIFAQNGVNWWYFEKLDSPYKGKSLPSLDPDGVIKRTFNIDSVIGGIINKPAELVEPGRIRLVDQQADRLVIGELDDRITPRLKEIAAVIESAGWPVLATDKVRQFKWRKQLSNAVFNPFGAVTQSSARQIGEFDPAKRAARTMMEEVVAVAASVGVKMDITVDEMLDGLTKRLEIPSSTLQDVRMGRGLELAALTNAVIDIGRLTGVPTPYLDVIAALAGTLNRRIVEDRFSFPPTPVGGKVIRG